MTRAIRIHRHGGPDVLSLESCEVGEPGPGELRILHRTVGVNFIDVYHRTGLYPQEVPFTPGVEGVGVVDAVGANVTGWRRGDRVAYVGGPLGGYSEERCIPAERAIALPREVTDEVAAGGMLRGMTAQILLKRVYAVQAGDTILVHAAAGGMGVLMCRWGAALGATVIGTVSTKEKASLAREHGCTHPIVTSDEDFVERVLALTNRQGVPVVYDSVGRDTLMRSLECLRPRGMLVSYGQSSGAPPPFEVRLLGKGSLSVSRPTLFHFIASRAELEQVAGDFFDALRRGHARVVVGQRYPLARAADAHRALEARATTGSTILTVE